MTTRRAISFEADLDISDVTRGLRRIEQQARRTGSTVGRVGGGLGRAGGGIGRTVGAGAGIGAGLAVFELAFQKIFELFEGTPILETFVMALDGIFTAAGPLIGVLLEALLPVIVALTPAIEPLTRALVPLIELFGAGLLVAVHLITPAIILFANGLENVTTFIRDVVLSAFRFIVDQLNKLPFIDIQVELDKTGDSFDTMAGQIADAGAMSDDAAPKVEATGDAIEEAGEQAGKKGQGGATDEFLALVESIKATTEATGGLSRLEDSIARRREYNASVAYLVGIETERLGRINLQNAKATQILNAQMSELGVPIDHLGFVAGVAETPISALDQAIADMTTQINEAQTAADLNQAAFDALSPAMMAAAIELGIFRGEIEKVGETADTVLSAARYAGSASITGAGRAGQTSTVRVDENGNLVYGESFGGAGGPSASSSQRLFSDATGNVFYDQNFRNPASSEAQQLADRITVNVQVGDETVEALIETNNQRSNLTGQ